MIRNNWKKLALAGAIALPAIALYVFSQSTIQVGYVVVSPDPLSPLPVGTALFSFRNPEGVLVSEAGVGAVVPIGRGRIFVDPNARTGVALANPSQQTVVLDLTLRDADGVVLQGGTATLTLEPRQHVSRFVDEIFNQIPANFLGSMTFEARQAGQTVAAITIRQRLNNRVPPEPLSATLPVVDLDQADSGRQTLVFPHVGAGAILSTQIILINRSSQRTSGLIRLTASDGTPLVVTMGSQTGNQFPYTLEPNGVFVGDLTNDQGVVQGYAEVTLTQGSSLPAGTAIFQFTSDGSPVSEAGVADIPPTRRARIFVDNNATQTGVAIASPGNAALTVTFDLLDRNGLFIERRTRQIPASGHTSIFVDDLFEIAQDFTGQMEISADEDIVPITLKFTTNSRGDFILTTLPVADLTRPVVAEFSVFPQVGFGSLSGIGSFSTRLIYLNTAAASPSQGIMAFFQSDGSDLVVPLDGQIDSQFTYDVTTSGARQFFPGVEAGLAAIVISQANLVVNAGATAGLRPITLDELGNARDDFPLEYSSLDTNVVTVDEMGTLQGVSRGFSTVTVSSEGIVVTVSVTVATVTSGPEGFGSTGVAQDFGRRVYLSNTSAHTILISEDVTEAADLFAGVPRLAGFLNSSREMSRFDRPTFIALNQASGNLYVSDSENHAIRVVRTGQDGSVTTLTGDRQRPGSSDGTLAEASFRTPQGVALDNKGMLWVVDSGNHTIRRIDLATGMVDTVAGSPGQSGLADGQGGVARFNTPLGIALEMESLERQQERALNGEPPPPVSVIVADSGNGVLRRVIEDGTVTTLQANTVTAVATRTGRLGTVNTPYRFTNPAGVAVDPFGTIFVSEPGAARVRALLADGEVIQAVQSGTFDNPRGMAVTTRGRVVVAETRRSVQEIRYAGPSIQDVTPNRVTAGQPVLVRVLGRNFASDTRVVLGGRAVEAQVVNTGMVTFTTPSDLPNGRLTLTLIHRGGLDDSFLFVDAVRPDQLARGEIATVAGGSPFGGDLGLAEAASFNEPSGIAFDSAGNLYIADAANNRVRRIDAITRVTTTIAGHTRDRLSVPTAVAVDDGDNVYIADSGNNRVLRWSRGDEVLETIAGTGASGFSGDGGPALQATFDEPIGVAVASNGDVYVADTGNGRIRRIDADRGVITTFAGGFQVAGDFVALTEPEGLAFDSNDNLFAADPASHIVWRITPDGTIIRFAGNGVPGFSGDNSLASEASLSSPSAVALDADGNVFIADSGNNRIRVVGRGGLIQTVAGNGTAGSSGDGGFAGTAALNSPLGLAINTAGDLFISDTENHRIRRVAASNGALSNLSLIQAYAGTGEFPDPIDGDDADWAALDFPAGLAFNADGDLFVAGSDHQRIRRLHGLSVDSGSKASIDTVAGSGQRGDFGDGGPALEASLNEPMGIAFTNTGDLIFSDSANHRIRRVNSYSGSFLLSLIRLGNTTAEGSIVGIGGSGEPGYSGDGGQAGQANLDFPVGLAQDNGRLYIADQRNHRVRVIDLESRVITTVAGIGQAGFSGDGGPASEAALNSPQAVAVRNGQLFVADTANHRVRRISLDSGLITTVAGNGVAGFSGDGRTATAASLNQPTAIALDDAGNLFIADSGNNRVRMVNGQGLISTVAGNGHEGFGGDGGPAVAAQLNGIGGLALDADGNIYIADLANHRIRIVRRSP